MVRRSDQAAHDWCDMLRRARSTPAASHPRQGRSFAGRHHGAAPPGRRLWPALVPPLAHAHTTRFCRHPVFRQNVARVSYEYCKSRSKCCICCNSYTHIQVLRTYGLFLSVADAYFIGFSCFDPMFPVLHLDVTNFGSPCCICYIGTHVHGPPTTIAERVQDCPRAYVWESRALVCTIPQPHNSDRCVLL